MSKERCKHCGRETGAEMVINKAGLFCSFDCLIEWKRKPCAPTVTVINDDPTDIDIIGHAK